MKKTLIVVDMQNDFVSGALGSSEAIGIIPNVKSKIDQYLSCGDQVIFTRDTHTPDYLNTNEGKHLPVTHCVDGTDGWQVVPELDIAECDHIDKAHFGYTDWNKKYDFNQIELVGLCTDICVVSNAIILKAQFPEIDITVDASCCAGVTPASHSAALDTMAACQINIINR